MSGIQVQQAHAMNTEKLGDYDKVRARLTRYDNINEETYQKRLHYSTKKVDETFRELAIYIRLQDRVTKWTRYQNLEQREVERKESCKRI